MLIFSDVFVIFNSHREISELKVLSFLFVGAKMLESMAADWMNERRIVGEMLKKYTRKEKRKLKSNIKNSLSSLLSPLSHHLS